MWHALFTCDKASFICDKPHSYLTSLIHIMSYGMSDSGEAADRMAMRALSCVAKGCENVFQQRLWRWRDRCVGCENVLCGELRRKIFSHPAHLSRHYHKRCLLQVWGEAYVCVCVKERESICIYVCICMHVCVCMCRNIEYTRHCHTLHTCLATATSAACCRSGV